MTTKTTYDVTVARGENKTLEIANDKKTQLVVVKKDAQTGQLLAGATIQATLLRSNTPPFEAGQVFTATTGADGRAIFTDLITIWSKDIFEGGIVRRPPPSLLCSATQIAACTMGFHKEGES